MFAMGYLSFRDKIMERERERGFSSRVDEGIGTRTLEKPVALPFYFETKK
jgi:hypothetical protein